MEALHKLILTSGLSLVMSHALADDNVKLPGKVAQAEAQAKLAASIARRAADIPNEEANTNNMQAGGNMEKKKDKKKSKKRKARRRTIRNGS